MTVTSNSVRRFATLFLLCVGTTGCAYLSDRARDFGDCFRARGSVLMGFGGGVKAAGLAHAGVGASGFGPEREWWPSVAWDYGVARVGDRVVEAYPPVSFPAPYHAEAPLGPQGTEGHMCFILLPAVFSVVETEGDDTSFILWSAESVWQRVHAFDVEVSAHAILLGVNLGFSPGELADFLLGWFGLDLAADDQVEQVREPTE